MTALAMCLLAAGCLDTGQEAVSFPVYAAGTEIADIDARDGWSVTLDEAQLAFGPLYLCASTTAGDLCDPARGELLDSVVIDALDPEPVRIGRMDALEGRVQSLMYDLGFTWLITQTAPTPTEAGERLDGSSLVLRGTARRRQVEIPFEADVRVTTNTPGRTTVVGQIAPHRIGPDERGLLLQLDPRPWVEDVGFDDFLDADGQFAGQAPVHFAPESQPYRALRSGLTARARPRLQWGFAPR